MKRIQVSAKHSRLPKIVFRSYLKKVFWSKIKVKCWLFQALFSLGIKARQWMRSPLENSVPVCTNFFSTADFR